MGNKKYNSLNSVLELKIKQLSEKGQTQYEISKTLNVSKHNVFKVIHNYKIYDRGNVITLHHVNDNVFNDLTQLAIKLDTKVPLLVKKYLRHIINELKKPAS